MIKSWNFAMAMIGLTFGLIIGLKLSELKNKINKKYPIEVQTYWTTDGFQSFPKMECDSIKGDTLYKDGSIIINKNIINVLYK